MIAAIYGNNPHIGLYTLPLLIWHPMQIVLGSLIVRPLTKFMEREKARLLEIDVEKPHPAEEGDEETTARPGIAFSSSASITSEDTPDVESRGIEVGFQATEAPKNHLHSLYGFQDVENVERIKAHPHTL